MARSNWLRAPEVCQLISMARCMARKDLMDCQRGSRASSVVPQVLSIAADDTRAKGERAKIENSEPQL